jgi:AP2-associated kinase
MFLNSPTAAAVKFPVVSSVDSSSASLDVPSPDSRSQRTARRTSISDMVQRYEAMGSGSAAPSPVSRPPTSSAQTGVGASLARSATTHVSPSPRRGHLSAAVGLPGLATEPSKKPPPTGLGVSDKPRAERASPVGLPGLATTERKPSASYGGSGLRSPVKQSADVTTTSSGGGGGLDIPVRPVPIRSVSPVNTPAGEEASSSPTTTTAEKPYQGVGRLIDQWQRKTADAEAPRSPVSRRRGGGGVGGGGAGATSSPRRAGVIAGRGAQD